MSAPLHATVAGWLLGQPSGANRRLLALLAELGPMLAAGERITLLHRADHTPPPLPGVTFATVAIPAAPTWRRVLAERAVLARTIRELHATVHDHGFLPLPRLPVPTCLLIHDLRAVDGDSRWPRWLARRVVRSSCSRANAVVTPSAWTAARLRELAPAAPPPIVVANGVTFPSEVLPLLPLPPAAGYLLHVGHVEARKNLTVVVDALSQLPATARPELWLAGRDAGALPQLLARARTRDVRVNTLGVVDDQALTSLYGHARAVVMPSRHEGFGLPALEALAHGRPVLVSSAGALPEVVGPCAHPLPPDDPRAWAQAIADLGNAPFDAALARRHAAQFSWRTAANRLLVTWRELSG